MNSQWDQISATKLVNNRKANVYQYFKNFIKGSIWAQSTEIKGLKEF